MARQDKAGEWRLGEARRGQKARKGPVLFGSVILIIIAGVGLVLGGRWLVDTINYVSTDDAAIDGNHVNVSAKTLGRISKLLAEEGDKVASGQVLVLLDDTDLRAQEAQASASLAYAKRNVELSKINLDRAQSDSDRARTLLDSGATTKEQAEHAANALRAASAQYAIALAQVDTASAQLGVLEDQLLNTRISSPMAGVVAKKYMMQGDVVQPGQTIYTINDLDRVWVTANFEETKIRQDRARRPGGGDGGRIQRHPHRQGRSDRRGHRRATLLHRRFHQDDAEGPRPHNPRQRPKLHPRVVRRSEGKDQGSLQASIWPGGSEVAPAVMKRILLPHTDEGL